jgi:hypothetical protein
LAWFHSILPVPFSKGVISSWIYRGTSIYEQESGVVVLDKNRHIFGILASCLLNAPIAKEIIRRETHGEKETFWLGFEIAQEEYGFLNDYAGIISWSDPGARHPPEEMELCGHLAHFDPKGDLLWMNDGLITSKRHGWWHITKFRVLASRGTWRRFMYTKEWYFIPADTNRLLDEFARLWEENPLAAKTNRTDRNASPTK